MRVMEASTSAKKQVIKEEGLRYSRRTSLKILMVKIIRRCLLSILILRIVSKRSSKKTRNTFRRLSRKNPKIMRRYHLWWHPHRIKLSNFMTKLGQAGVISMIERMRNVKISNLRTKPTRLW